jgi:hypothetical protein
MEEKQQHRRHTAEGQQVPAVKASKDCSKGEDYSLEQKFAEFAKITDDGAKIGESKTTDAPRRATEGCDTKFPSNSSVRSNSSAHRGSKQVDVMEEDDVGDMEFEALMRKNDEGSVEMSSNPKAQEIMLGFRL